ncbi:MAG: TPM domain-containing protein [Lachnospiraceae bacterium]|nr:TPM domain-containing protein [Lachnospiraceae bacterium]
MKKNLYKIVWMCLALVLAVGCLLPASTAMADTNEDALLESIRDALKEFHGESGEDFYFELEPEDDYDSDYDFENWYEEDYDFDKWYESDYEKARQILEENLARTGMSLDEDQRIYDFFGKFSRGDLNEIDGWIEEKEEEGDISIRVFVAEMDMNMEKYFLEECADALCDNGYAKEDLAIMLLNLDYNNRGVCIQGYGLCEERVNDDRTEYILDDIIEHFSDDDYVYGVKLFATEAAYYAQSTNYGVYFKDNSFEGKMKRMPWPLVLLAPAVVAFVGILLMKGSKGGKMTTNGKTYIQNGVSGLTANKDDYVRTDVSKTYSPVSSGSSGGRSGGGRSSGGGGRSSGGRSHSGGSRRF